MIKELIKKLFPLQYERLLEGCCPICGTTIRPNEEDFEDELSKKEFQISGLCQKCQWKVFGYTAG